MRSSPPPETNVDTGTGTGTGTGPDDTTTSDTNTRDTNRVVFLCAACVAVGYCDRLNLATAIVDIGQEQGWDLVTKGRVLGAFFWGYLLTQYIGAVLARRYGAKIVLTTAVLAWSALTIGLPFFVRVDSGGSMGRNSSSTVCVISRVLVGAAEGVVFPCVYHLFSIWVPPSQRSRSVAILSTGVFTGAVAALTLSPFLMTSKFGWPSVFYFFGFIGLLWVVLWVGFFPGPSKQTRGSPSYMRVDTTENEKGINATSVASTASELQLSENLDVESLKSREYSQSRTNSKTSRNRALDDGDEEEEGEGGEGELEEHEERKGKGKGKGEMKRGLEGVPGSHQFHFRDELQTMKKIFTTPVCLAIMFCHWSHNAGHFVLMSWLPTFFHDVLGYSGNNLAVVAAPYICLAIGVTSVSKVADYYVNKGVPLLKVRRISTILGFSSAAFFMLTLTVLRNPTVSVVLICLALGANGSGPVSGYEAMKLDIASTRVAGTFQSVSNTISTTSGIFLIPVVAYLKELTGSWDSVFIGISSLFLFAAAVFYKWGKWSGGHYVLE